MKNTDTTKVSGADNKDEKNKNTEETFGSFLYKKRREHEVTLRGFAKQLDISPVYMSNLENNIRAAPAPELLERIMSALFLTDSEKIYALDLAAKSKYSTSVPIDLPEYIMEHEIVRTALRTAKDGDATDKEWGDFIKKINSRIKKERKERGRNDE